MSENTTLFQKYQPVDNAAKLSGQLLGLSIHTQFLVSIIKDVKTAAAG